MTNDDLPESEKKLFRDAMRHVAPLEHSKHRTSSKKHTTTHIKQRFLSDHYDEIVGPETTLKYAQLSFPPKRLRELSTGKFTSQDQLDLHGLYVEEAREALIQFIHEQQQLGHTNVFIIHGKGGQQGQEPILKNHVNHWLQQMPEVLAFHSALPKHGGAGALYVLLKLHKPKK